LALEAMGRDATRAMGVRPLLFVSYSGVLGGAERILLDGATRLGEPVVLVCPDGPLAAQAHAAGLLVEPTPPRPLRLRAGPAAAARHAAGLAGLARDTARASRRHAPRAVIAWGARAILASALRRGGPPLLAVHNDLIGGGPVAAAVRRTTARADRVAALSHAIAADVARAPARPREPDPARAGEIAVLHPGVDLDAWHPAPVPDGPSVALVLGALVPWKRPELALEVAARVPRLRLELAGEAIPGDDPAYAHGLRRRAEALGGRVRFLGRVEDPRPALARARLLLHCADAEPYGLALVEALAAARPVVAPAAGGPLEIVGDGAGRLYPPGDAGAAAGAVEAVLDDDAAAAAARARAEACFDVRDSARRLREALP